MNGFILELAVMALAFARLDWLARRHFPARTERQRAIQVIAGIAAGSVVVGLLSGESGAQAALLALKIALLGIGLTLVRPLAKTSMAAYVAVAILDLVAAAGVLMWVGSIVPQ